MERTVAKRALPTTRMSANDRHKAEAIEGGRIRIRARLGFGPDGSPEVDALIEHARVAGCRTYDQFDRFIKARLGVNK